MPTVDAAKIKIRRGLNLDRKKVILDEGEFGYTTDTKRTYIGDGSTIGGNAVGAKNFQLNSISNLSNAEPGDFIFNNNIFYCLTGTDFNNPTNWFNLNPRVDDTTIGYDSDNVLYVKSSGLGLSSVGIGLGLDSNNDPYVDFASDAQTSNFFNFNSSNQIEVGKLTDISHGPLGYQDTDAGIQHHSDATATNPGFMPAIFWTKLDNSPSFPITQDQSANLIMAGVNRSTADKINASRIDGTVNASSSLIGRSVVRYLGQNQSNIEYLSGDNLTTPYYFLNREDFPGTTINTSIPSNYVSNQGSYNNIKIANVGANTTDDAYYQDKTFILPSGAGKTYAIFIQKVGDDTRKNSFAASYPQYTIAACNYSATQPELVVNIMNAIRNITNGYGERLYDVWNDESDIGSIYIHDLVKGYTPTFNSGYAEGPDTAYQISTEAAVTYEQSAGYVSKEGSGFSASDNTSGITSLSKLGWLKLLSSNQSLLARGIKSIHTVSNFPEPNTLDGKYFLLYDTNDNRFCIWYNRTLGATAPNISNSQYRRGHKTIFIEVNINTAVDNTAVADLTVTALENNAYFNTVYDVEYDVTSVTMTFTSKKEGYSDGVVNRVSVGMGGDMTFTPNSTAGSPDITALNGAFYNAYNLASPTSDGLPQNELKLPATSSVNTFQADDGVNVETATLLKFR